MIPKSDITKLSLERIIFGHKDIEVQISIKAVGTYPLYSVAIITKDFNSGNEEITIARAEYDLEQRKFIRLPDELDDFGFKKRLNELYNNLIDMGRIDFKHL